MKILRILLLTLVTIAAAVLLAYTWQQTQNTSQATPPVVFNQPYNFTNQNGQTVTNATLLGKPTLYFFGFTHCPDICPTTLATLTTLLEQLGPQDASRLNVVFVSVDPERDTPSVLKTYLKSFHPAIIGLSGTPAQLADLTRQMMVYYAKVPLPGGGYTMDHSAMVIMADSKATFRGTISHEDSEAVALAKVKKLLANP